MTIYRPHIGRNLNPWILSIISEHQVTDYVDLMLSIYGQNLYMSIGITRDEKVKIHILEFQGPMGPSF